MEASPKFRGRPRGVKNGEGKALEPIKNWKTKYEQIVALSMIPGWTNVRIAERFGMTPVRVSQILNDPHAKAIVRATNLKLREKIAEDIHGKLLELSKTSVDRISETLEHTDFVLGSDAKKHQDNLGLQLLKGVGFLPGARDAEDENKGPTGLPVALAERLTAALERSNEAERLNAQPIVEAKVVKEGVWKIADGSPDVEIVSTKGEKENV